MKRTSIAAMSAVLLLAAPALTGCFSGAGATTNMQAGMNSGDGVEAEIGDIDIENATLVLGPEGSKSATLLVTFVNTGLTPDLLVNVAINGTPATVTEGYGEIKGGAVQNFGIVSQDSSIKPLWINTYDLEVPQSSYVPVDLAFQNAGVIKLSVLTVPAVGIYAGIAPSPAAAPAG